YPYSYFPLPATRLLSRSSLLATCYLPLPPHPSPHPTDFRAHHGFRIGAAKRLVKLREIGYDSVYSIFARRMGIRDGVDPKVLRPLVFAGPLSHADEEALVRSEAVDRLKFLFFRSVLPGDVSKQRPADVGDVL